MSDLQKLNVYSNNNTMDKCSSSSYGPLALEEKDRLCFILTTSANVRNRKLPWIEVLRIWFHARLHVQLVPWLWVLRCGAWVKSSLMNETSRLMKRTAPVPLAHTLMHTDTNTLHVHHNMHGQPMYIWCWK